MDESTLGRLIDEHSRFPQVLAPLFDGVATDLLRARDRPDRWSPLEILVHLLEEEVFDFRARAQAAAARRPIEHSIDPEGWISSRGYNAKDPALAADEFDKERHRSVDWLRSLSLEDLNGETTFPNQKSASGGGVIRCGDFIAAWRMHDLLHLRQLATTFARLEAQRLTGWATDYAGPVP